MSSSPEESAGVEDGEQYENVQKFNVLTSRRCAIHGCRLGSGEGSTGRIVLIEDSSSSENFQTMSLLSFPCLDFVRILEAIKLRRSG